jgi:hypothetical protein
MESPARLLQHGRTGIKAGEQKADSLKRGEVKSGAAADVEEPLPGTRLEEAVDERALQAQGLLSPPPLIPILIVLGTATIEEKPH